MSEEHHEAQARCPGCKKLRPLSELCGLEAVYDPESEVLMLCEGCRSGNRHPVEADPFAALALQERRLVASLMDGLSIAAAARASGVSETRARKLVKGTAKPVFREIFQSILKEKGLTPDALASTLSDCLTATKQQWNSEDRGWDEFEDWNNRLKTVQLAAKFLQIDEPERKGAQMGDTLSITIITNLDGPTPEAEQRSFVARSLAAKDVTPDAG